MNDKTKKNLKKVGIYAAITLILAAMYYVTLPPINIHSFQFWVSLTVTVAAYSIPNMFKFSSVSVITVGNTPIKEVKFQKKLGLISLAPIALFLVLSIASSTFFNAKAYAGVITVTEAVFEEDMPMSTNVTNIALMDSASAQIVGNRTLGSLSNVVSQYEIAPTYNQINYQRTPQKVANLEYAGFFKWFGNRDDGIPGFVMVDPVNNDAEYKEFAKPMKYAESGFFSDDLMRKLRFSYPTKIFDTPRFEVDDEMHPYYIVPCLGPRVGLFGAMDVKQVILFDPTDGSSEIYDLEDTPAWVDIVFGGDLATEKYNWKGMLSGGFWNSVIGNKDCKKTTDDYGYIVIEDDVWYYTGVTSVNSDKSNIGFIITNARTGEYKFYPVIGAEEHSAMAAAQGEVQEKGYVASFPALVNVEGQPTYIMVLKDAGGLVKLYALVNVEQYSIVATGTTQEKAMDAYRALLVENEILDEDELSTPPADEIIDNAAAYHFTVSDIRIVDTGKGDTIYLGAVIDEKYTLFRAPLSGQEALLLIREGDAIGVLAIPTETDGILEILKQTDGVKG